MGRNRNARGIHIDDGPRYSGPVLSADRVLLIEPDDEVRQHLRRVFERSGYGVTALGSDAGRALQEVMRNCPDLIVMAERSAGNGTRELLGYLWDACPVPVIMLGASQDGSDAIPYFEMGVDVYLSPPVDTRELLARAKNLLRLVWNRYEDIY